MNTRKLYYEDCHMQTFTATVTGCEKTDRGYLVTLDATAFYPEGGGQACDLGTLGGVNVLDVREKEEIVHLCDGPLAVGSQVEGQIDWPRRYYQMQQHTGEHIVSGVISRLFGGHNVGFHIGADAVTLDFDIPISPEGLNEVERLANEAIYKNLTVKCTVPSPEELEKITYRAKRKLPWPVRIVQVPGYDTCACCGVHVERTGELGVIKLISCVKFHEGVRIEMLCGIKAYEYLCHVFEQNRQVSQAFSAKMLQTGEAAQRMNDALAKEKFRTVSLQRQLFAAIAKGFAESGDVVYFAEDLESAALRILADTIAETCGGTAAVFSGTDETGYSLCLVNKARDIGPLGQDLAKTLQGRGGGKNGFFQGSVRATQKDIEEFFGKTQMI